MIRPLFARLCLGASAILAVTGVHAQDFPTKPLRLIVAFGPGGVADVTARIVAEGLSEKLGKPIVVENMPSAGGITAAVALTRSAPDGHTLFIVSNQNAVSPSLFKSLPYDPLKQFAMISMVGSFDIVMAVDQNSPLRTVADAIAAAKKDPQHFNLGTIGVGSTQHLSSEMFRSMAKLDVPTIPFKSSGEVLSAVKGKSVQVMFETVPAVIGNVKGGSLRLLGVASTKRSPLFPDVPTIAETVPGYTSVSWNGFAAPAGTPPAIVDKLNTAIREVVKDPAINKKLVDVGMIPQTNTPKEFHDFLGTEIDKWRKVIEMAKIEKQ